MDREIIRYKYVVGVLKKKQNPFRMKYKEHFVKVPNVSGEILPSIEDEFVDLLDGIGWEYDVVAMFRGGKDGAFFAWRCVPKTETANFEPTTHETLIPR